MVKCRDCGYLTIKVRSTRELIEADSTYREDGGKHQDYHSVNGVYEACSLCFVHAIDFRKEWQKNGIVPDIRLKVISAERECDEFIEWEQGFSPKEHAERRLRERLLQSDREWREAQERQAHEWRKEDVELIKAGMKSSVWTQIAVAVISAAAAFAVAGFAYVLSIQGQTP